jgi:DNA-binding MarR family transcriptional regulator
MAHAVSSGTIGATMTLDDLADDGWPPQRVGSTNPRVVNAIFGGYHAVTRRLHLATRQHGLEAGEALVLAVVLREPGCSPGQIRANLGLHRSTLSSILDRLQLDGLIHRAPSSIDGRRFEISLTTAGRISAEIAEFVIHDIEAEIASYSSRAERAGARAVFEACVAIGRPGRRTEL